MDTNILMIGVITGSVGYGYFIYGKRQGMAIPMISGVILCIYPYFTDNIWILSSIGFFLIVLPFILKF